MPTPSFGRPPMYCSRDCRVQMDRRRRDLKRLEAEITDAHTKAADNSGQGTLFWRNWGAMLERQADELRVRTRKAARRPLEIWRLARSTQAGLAATPNFLVPRSYPLPERCRRMWAKQPRFVRPIPQVSTIESSARGVKRR